MKKLRFKIEIWQILFVIVASAFAVVFLNSIAYGLTPETFLDSITHTFIIASSVCIGIFYFAPKVYDYSSVKRVAIITLVIFVATMIGLFLTKLFLGSFNNYGIENYYTPSRRTVIFSLVISYTFGLSTYFYLHSQNKLRRTKELLRQKELDEAKAKSLAVSAQLASLESKIHPHFLFNTLNSIAALIKEDPDKAEKMVEKLSALLRYSLDLNAISLVSLKQELEITEKYLEIEKMRFDKRLDYKIEIDAKFSNIKLPPLALQTIVENSVKHVASKTSDRTEIVISTRENGTGIILEVRDTGAGFSSNSIQDGHGLDILQKRLTTIFQNKARLEISKNVNGCVKLILPKEHL